MWFDGVLLERLEAWAGSGRAIVLATIASSRGSSPRPVGSVFACTDAGEVYGAVSNGCVENEIIDEAASVFRDGEPKCLRYGVGDGIVAANLLCGGEIVLYLERVAPSFVRALREAYASGKPFDVVSARGAKEIRVLREAQDDRADAVTFDASRMELRQRFVPPPRFVLLGAGDISEALAVFAHSLGYRVVLIDPRPEYARRYVTPEHYERVIEAWPEDALASLALDRSSAVVALFHEQRFEIEALAYALERTNAYVGALGSRRVQREREAALRERGCGEEALRRLHAPVGLDIGADAPKEIALAILAEIVAVRNGRAGGALKDGSGPITTGKQLC